MAFVIRDIKAYFVKVYRIFEALLNLRNPISYNLHNSGTNSSQSPSYLSNDAERATSLHNEDNVYTVD
jgi:hypothetical protein